MAKPDAGMASRAGALGRQTLAKIGEWRRWVESAIVSFINWLARLLAVVGWACIVLVATGTLYWLTARMMGWPLYVAVRVNPSELVAIGVFLFCAAFALSSRDGRK